MTYYEYLNKIIDDGIVAAKMDYEKYPHKMKGAVEGFEACRSKTPEELSRLLTEANEQSALSNFDRSDLDFGLRYWEKRCFALEVEWVCNCVSAAFIHQGIRIVTPTARGVIKAGEVLGMI